MNTNATILITGAAGFIASCMAAFLNRKGFDRLILVDDFSRSDKQPNFESLRCFAKVDRNHIDTYLNSSPSIDFVIHFGARTDTTEMDYEVHKKLNLDFSKKIWSFCTEQNIPLIYASSAATYGGGEFGYDDDHDTIERLQPLNPYGVSKHQFDLFALNEQDHCPPHWYGLKFFNVFGPNEYHKGRMASVVLHAFNQINTNGKLKLFRSHHPDFKDGEQQRDFIYVLDVMEVTWWLMNHLPENGIYNLGTGVANTFLELAHAIFESMKLEPEIEFIDTPIDIREKYQYYTQANMSKLRKAGYTQNFYTLNESVDDYIRHYLNQKVYYCG